MQLEHQFTVAAPVDVVWRAMLEPERVAPCMPGATLTGVDGTKFTGSVKVKMGPISLLYKGAGEFVDIDEHERRVMIKASGKDSRGNGTAAATVTVTLSEQDSVTHGHVLTDLAITGKPAQFGRGLIAEVGGKILGTFADCLAGKLSTPAPPATAEAPPAEAPPVAEQRPPAETEAVDLLGYAGTPVLKRIAPVLAVIAVLVFLLARRRRR